MEEKVKKVSSVEGVPSPRASYSVYTQVGNFVFLAGQVAVDPKTKEIPKRFSDQVHLVLGSIQKTLESVGSSMDHVLKTTVFLKSRSYLQEYDKIYRSYFKAGYPARSTIVAEMAHEDFLIEIEAIGWIPQRF